MDAVLTNQGCGNGYAELSVENAPFSPVFDGGPKLNLGASQGLVKYVVVCFVLFASNVENVTWSKHSEWWLWTAPRHPLTWI